MKNKETKTFKTIYFLANYNWERGELIKECRKNYKIWGKVGGCNPSVLFVAKEKCAFPNDEVCVVWETWRGVNGRGGYRVEREGYSHKRIPAKEISRQHPGGKGRVTEDFEGGNIPQLETKYDPEKMQDALLTVDSMVADPYDHDYYNLAEATKSLVEQVRYAVPALETMESAYRDLLNKHQEGEAKAEKLENENNALYIVQAFADALMHATLKNIACLPDVCKDELLDLTNSLEYAMKMAKYNEIK